MEAKERRVSQVRDEVVSEGLSLSLSSQREKFPQRETLACSVARYWRCMQSMIRPRPAVLEEQRGLTASVSLVRRAPDFLALLGWLKCADTARQVGT